MAADLPRSARVVIVGGGVVGCSVAYHLARAGVSDVVLLERRELTCGTTWHAAGLIGQLRPSKRMTELAKYTAELYTGLEAETGQATGFKQNGSISLATHAGRMEELKRSASMAKVFDLRVDVLGPDEIKERYPLIAVDDVVGGIFIPSDGQANPIDVSRALAKGARDGGVLVRENTPVTAIAHDGERIAGVETPDGAIHAETVVLSAGMWTRELAATIGVHVPLHACEHFYVMTDPFEGVTPNLPVLRDYDGCAYYKEDAGKILLGAFEPDAKPWGVDGIPEDFCFDQLPDDFEHFEPVLMHALKRMPALADAGIQTFFCGPESFTPDDRYHLGEAPGLAGCYVAAGFNSIGIQSAGGAGKVLAACIKTGRPLVDMWDVDIRRNLPFQTNRRYLRERVSETLGLLYDDHWPFRQFTTARGVRRSPFHDRLAARGACHGRGLRLGAAQLVRDGDERWRAPLRIQLPPAPTGSSAVAGRVPGGRGSAWGSSTRPLRLRQVRGLQGPRRGGGLHRPASAPTRPPRGIGPDRPCPQWLTPSGGSRLGVHRDPARRGRLSDRDLRRVPGAGCPLAPAPHA